MSKPTIDPNCACGNESGSNVDNCERCRLVARIRQLEELSDDIAANLAEYAYEAYMLASGSREAPSWANLPTETKHFWRTVVIAIYKVITRQPERFGLHRVRTKGAHPLSERELLK